MYTIDGIWLFAVTLSSTLQQQHRTKPVFHLTFTLQYKTEVIVHRIKNNAIFMSSIAIFVDTEAIVKKNPAFWWLSIFKLFFVIIILEACRISRSFAAQNKILLLQSFQLSEVSEAQHGPPRRRHLPDQRHPRQW